MDSIDDSLLSRALIQIAHHVDRLQQNWPGALIVVAAFALYYSLFGRRGDVILIAVAAALPEWPRRLGLFLAGQKLYTLGGLLLASCGVVLVSRLLALTTFRHRVSSGQKNFVGNSSSFFIPSRTTHTRFFPKKHSFTYSYLTVGIPVGLRCDNVNGILSVDSPAVRRWWSWLFAPVYDVSDADHLARGVDKGGLREKLRRFLVEQKVDPDQYPHAFLVTAPSFLGYSFSPVSFWFLYSSDRVLSAMILEVNNTFDERRSYLVFRDFANESKRHAEALAPASTEAARIAASFDKDFHVSPFNSRNGSYSVLAGDPLGPDLQGFRGLDVTITLQSSKGHPKLVARLASQTPAVEVASMSPLQKIAFVGQWFWVGFVTFPRIVREAAVLFFRRGLHVWYRPEPLRQSLGRRATGIERDLEAVFRGYLRHRVEQAPIPLRVRYVAGGIAAETAVFTSLSGTAAGSTDSEDGGAVAASPSATPLEVEFCVLTPDFYARFVRYAHDLEGIFNELTESRTLAVDKPEALPHIFLRDSSAAASESLPLRTSSLVDYLGFRLAQSLRRSPEPIRRPMTSAAAAAAAAAGPATATRRGGKLVDIRRFRIAPMDAYVLEHGGDAVRHGYRVAVLRLFIAHHMFFGIVELLLLAEWAWRVALAYGLVYICS